MKTQEVSVPATGGLGSLCQCLWKICGKQGVFPGRTLGPFPQSSPKVSSSMSNINRDIAVLSRKEAGSTRPGWKPIQVEVSKWYCWEKSLQISIDFCLTLVKPIVRIKLTTLVISTCKTCVKDCSTTTILWAYLWGSDLVQSHIAPSEHQICYTINVLWDMITHSLSTIDAEIRSW